MALVSTDSRLAAMSRHPSAGQATAPPAGASATFAETVSLLTGQWRVDDPDGFAAAVTGEPVIAGHPVLSAGVRASAADPWTARAWAGHAAALAGLASRDEVEVCAVSGAAGPVLFVEARAEAPARPGDGAVFALAHLLEPRVGADGAGSLLDHSWILVVAGDPAGGVSGVLRAVLRCPAWCGSCPAPAPWAGPDLERLRMRLLEEAGVPVQLAPVLPFPVSRAVAEAPMLGASSAT